MREIIIKAGALRHMIKEDANGLKMKKSDSAFNHKEIFKKGGFNNVESR